METIRIENRIGVRAPAERIWDVLTDFAGWRRWNPHETDIEGVLGFGAAIRLTERLPDLGERRIEARLGEQSGVVWNACVNIAPSWPMRSMCGVFM